MFESCSEPHRLKRHQIYEIGSQQGGYFTTQQAHQLGVSSQLLRYYIQTGELERAMRGVYRLTFFPTHEEEQLIQLWLWSERTGVFSHETALVLHQLSDVLPTNIHLTFPVSWQTKRIKIPTGLLVHYDTLQPQEIQFYSTVHITTPTRTLLDCIQTHVSPELMEQATLEALQRGLLSPREIFSCAQNMRITLPQYIQSFLREEESKA